MLQHHQLNTHFAEYFSRKAGFYQAAATTKLLAQNE